VLEGGFDRYDRFFFIPLGANEALAEIWRCKVVALFLDKGLLNPNFAQTLLKWRHSGFSIDSGTRIYDEDARRSLSQGILQGQGALFLLSGLHRPTDAPHPPSRQASASPLRLVFLSRPRDLERPPCPRFTSAPGLVRPASRTAFCRRGTS